MGRVTSSVDNSMIESFWSTMQRELLDARTWQRPDQLGSAVFEWIEAWYDPAAGTPRWTYSPGPNTSGSTPTGSPPFPLPLPPKERQDHTTTRARRTGSGYVGGSTRLEGARVRR